MRRTEGRGRRREEGGRPRGPELEYKRGTDSRPHSGSREGWRTVVRGGLLGVAGRERGGGEAEKEGR